MIFRRNHREPCEHDEILRSQYWEWRLGYLPAEDTIATAQAAIDAGCISRKVARLAKVGSLNFIDPRERQTMANNRLSQVGFALGLMAQEEQVARARVHRLISSMVEPGAPILDLADQVWRAAIVLEPDADELVVFLLPEEDRGETPDELQEDVDQLRQSAAEWLSRHPEPPTDPAGS